MKTTLFTSFILLILYSVVLFFKPIDINVFTQSQWQQNQYVVEKYFRSADFINSSNVLVGSSLSQRMNIDPYSSCTYNLSLGGDGALTGIEAILKSRSYPKAVWIEINAPERDVTHSLIDDALSPIKTLPLFYTENAPLNLIFGYGKYKILEIAALSKMPDDQLPTPDQPIKKEALSSMVKTYHNTLSPKLLNEKIEQYSLAVSKLESHGISIGFYEMPVNPSLEDLARARQIREAFLSKFFFHKFISYVTLSKGISISTSDGIHLQPTEAEFVSKQLINAIDSYCHSSIKKSH